MVTAQLRWNKGLESGASFEIVSKWIEIAQDDNYTQCPGVGNTCVHITHDNQGSGFTPGVSIIFEMRIRRAASVLATSPKLEAVVPIHDTEPLNANLSGVLLPSSFDSYGVGVATGSFRTDLEFTNPRFAALNTKRV